MQSIAEKLFLTVADRRCRICLSGQQPICAACFESEFISVPPVCMICNAVSDDYSLCRGCYRNFPLNRIYAACMYESAARDMIIKIKAASSRDILRQMAEYLADSFRYYFDKGDVLMPLPSSPAAARLRGFDVATALAELLSEKLSLEVAKPLSRISNTRQKSLNMNQRLDRRNQELYRVNPAKLPDKSRRLILVDDVMTTGSTLASAARLLRRQGHRRIDGLVMARSPWS